MTASQCGTCSYSCKSMQHLSIMSASQSVTCQYVRKSMCHQSVMGTSQCVSCYHGLRLLCHMTHVSRSIHLICRYSHTSIHQYIISQLRMQANASPVSCRQSQCIVSQLRIQVNVSPVASFTKEVNPRLVFNGRLANCWLTPLVKKPSSYGSYGHKLMHHQSVMAAVNVLSGSYSCNSMGHLSIMATYQYVTCQYVHTSMCHQSFTVTSQCISCYYGLKSVCHLSASHCIWFVSMVASQSISQFWTQVTASPGSSGCKSMHYLQNITPVVDTLLTQPSYTQYWNLKIIYSQLKELLLFDFDMNTRHEYKFHVAPNHTQYWQTICP